MRRLLVVLMLGLMTGLMMVVVGQANAQAAACTCKQVPLLVELSSLVIGASPAS
jgi:hypothetical protein